MWIKVILLWASLSVAVLCVEDQHATIRNAMEHLLQVRAPSTSSLTGEDSPHLYMMELYKKYLASESMKNRSNTIRSISPYRGQVAGEEMLMFNLTGLSRSEEIGSVELHFYKRRAVSRKKVGQKMHHHHLLGFALGDDEDDYSDEDSDEDDQKVGRQIGKWQVALDKRGWQVYDVSAALAGRKLLVQQLGFKFQGVKRSSGRYESLSLESVLKMEPSPFLVVFSNERSNATLEETGIVSQRDVNALPDGQDEEQQETVDSSDIGRKRRSIDDNELPEADHHFNNNNVIPQTSPGVLQGRGSSSSPSGRTSSTGAASRKSGTLPYPKSHHHDRTTSTTSTTTDSSTLAWPEDKRKSGGGSSSGSRTGGGSSGGGRKGKRRNRKLPETWHYNQQQHINDARLDVPEDAGRSLCQRRKLTVDFNEIGWGEWIISPKTFEAQYCAGRCPFPLTKELNPTNHATIQSIVHAIGGHPEVPAPCCVPDVLSSLTLLYFDDNRNVVLKNYPSMTAESCACR